MKIILLKDSGGNFAMDLRHKVLVGVAAFGLLSSALFAGLLFFSDAPQAEVNPQLVAQWRATLNAHKDEVVDIERKHQAQTSAIGRQLAEMKARLLRMEAVGAHMATSANLDADEFDFSNPPAQGGPIEGAQPAWSMDELGAAISQLSAQIKQREKELNILDSVLIHEELNSGSVVQGRPVTWGWMSSPYGKRVDPLTGGSAWHAGVDFAGKEGSDVIAVASGVVTFAGERSGYGKIVEISHAGGYVTRYAHHRDLVVKTGDIVKKGDVVGKMGSSGRATGPHVHFEVLKNGRAVDPASYVARRT